MNNTIEVKTKPRRSWLVPLIIIAILLALILLEYLWDRFEISPAHYLKVGMTKSFSVMLAPVALFIWLVFFSGFARQTKWSIILLVMVGIIVGFAAIRKIEFNGQMRPIVYYRWHQLPQDDLPALQVAAALQPGDILQNPMDSPYFRGIHHDGSTPQAPEDFQWVSTSLEKLWQHPLGGGHAGISVVGNTVFTIEQRGGDECVVAYDAVSGKPRWSHQYSASFQHSEPMGGNGPRTTPVLENGLLYALGAHGHLHCIDALDGKVKWKTNIIDDAGAKNLEWGMSGSPLVMGETVIVNPGIDPEKKTSKAVIAYHRLTGKQLWATGSDQAGYASPMQATLAGVNQVLLFDASGLNGLDPQHGMVLWQYPWKTSFDMNCAQPIVVGNDRVFISSEVANGGAMLKISQTNGTWTVSEIWKNRYLGIKFSNAVLCDGHLYGLSNGYLTCVNANSGERLWKARQNYGNGQMLLAGRVLVITTESGEVALVEAAPNQFKELKRVPVFSGRTWNVPAIARGRLYLRNHQEIACLRLWDVTPPVGQ